MIHFYFLFLFIHISIASDCFVYRQNFTIPHSHGAGTFDKALVVNTAALIGSSMLENDCSDMRFKDGESWIDYWVSNGCNQAETVVWLRLEFTVSVSRDISMYFGCRSASLLTTKANVPSNRGNAMSFSSRFVLPSLNETCPLGTSLSSAVHHQDRYVAFGIGAAIATNDGVDWSSHNHGGSIASHAVADNPDSTFSALQNTSRPGRIATLHDHNIAPTIPTPAEGVEPAYAAVKLCLSALPVVSAETILVTFVDGADETIDSRFERLVQLDSRLLRASATMPAGQIGGSNSHTHPWVGTSAPGTGGLQYEPDETTGVDSCIVGHTHEIYAPGTSTSNLPDRRDVIFVTSHQDIKPHTYPSNLRFFIDSHPPPWGFTAVDMTSLGVHFPLGSSSITTGVTTATPGSHLWEPDLLSPDPSDCNLKATAGSFLRAPVNHGHQHNSPQSFGDGHTPNELDSVQLPVAMVSEGITWGVASIEIEVIRPSCYNIFVSGEEEPVCGGHGTCITENSTCVCSSTDDWRGSQCDIALCFGIDANSEEVCGGASRGTCNAQTHRCECSFVASGDQCELASRAFVASIAAPTITIALVIVLILFFILFCLTCCALAGRVGKDKREKRVRLAEEAFDFTPVDPEAASRDRDGKIIRLKAYCEQAEMQLQSDQFENALVIIMKGIRSCPRTDQRANADIKDLWFLRHRAMVHCGFTFEGLFSAGGFTDHGYLYLGGNLLYEGRFRYFLAHGSGQHYGQDGTIIYDGEWQFNQRHGYGKVFVRKVGRGKNETRPAYWYSGIESPEPVTSKLNLVTEDRYRDVLEPPPALRALLEGYASESEGEYTDATDSEEEVGLGPEPPGSITYEVDTELERVDLNENASSQATLAPPMPHHQSYRSSGNFVFEMAADDAETSDEEDYVDVFDVVVDDGGDADDFVDVFEG